MVKHRKTYRFRMEPTRIQANGMSRMAGARRWVWNWALQRRKEHYATHKKNLSVAELSRELTELKQRPETVWLKECDSQALQQTLRDLDKAFVAFFEKRAGFPRFKNRKTDRARFRIPQRVVLADAKVYVPKVGWVRVRQSRPVAEKTKSATFSRDGDGHWFVSLVVEFELPEVCLPYKPEKVVGIDLGLIDFATFSDNSPSIPVPKCFRRGQKRLRRAQRVVSRRKKGSRRRDKAKHRVNRIHQKVSRQRSDFLHKLTTKTIEKYDRVCIEDLCIHGLARTKLAKSFMDASFGEFRRQLEYKGVWNSKPVVVIDRYFPSSRLCNVCQKKNDKLSLSERHWRCECGAIHGRDRLASCNIRDEGLRMLAVGQTDSLNAQGVDVRPEKSGRRR